MAAINKFGLSRPIPDPIARQVRQACGFGCVVCGVAICDYEHIDPEFKDAQKHDPEKIALLCSGCHSKVTRKQWSKDKIKEARNNPICLKAGFSSDWFDYGNNSISIHLGRAVFQAPRAVITVFGRRLLQIKEPEHAGGPIRICADFFGESGEPLFSIEDNLWKGPIDNWDIEVVGPKITIRKASGDIGLILETDPRRKLMLNRLEMQYRGVRIKIDERGIFFGRSTEKLIGVTGTIIEPESCFEITEDDGQPTGALIQVRNSSKGIFEGNTITGYQQPALSIASEGLVLQVGRNATLVRADLIRDT